VILRNLFEQLIVINRVFVVAAVSFHEILAATANPVESLRYE